MKRNIARTGFVVIFAAAWIVSMAASAQAAGPCSLELAAGTYGLTDTGTVVGVGPRAAVGIWTQDEAGNVNGKATSSLNGTIFHEKFSGTATVNPDCTGTFAGKIFDLSGNVLFTVTVDLAWDDNMREFRFIFTSAKLPNGAPLLIVINGDARKLVAENVQ